MNPAKTPVLLTTIVRSEKQQWFVAGVTPDGKVTTLVRSEPGNLDAYVGQSLDDQVTFLRHRLSGALQRAFDRLWGHEMKTRHIVIVIEGSFPEGDPALPKSIAEHFNIWMTYPEATTFASSRLTGDDHLEEYERLAGTLPEEDAQALQAGWPALMTAIEQPTRWETIHKPVV